MLSEREIMLYKLQGRINRFDVKNEELLEKERSKYTDDNVCGHKLLLDTEMLLTHCEAHSAFSHFLREQIIFAKFLIFLASLLFHQVTMNNSNTSLNFSQT
jgi:hypothetical protein